MIERFKRIVRRHWRRLRLHDPAADLRVRSRLAEVWRTVTAVYDNSLVRQTEAELVSQSAALAAAAAVEWPGRRQVLTTKDMPEPPSIDLRMTRILPERPTPHPSSEAKK